MVRFRCVGFSTNNLSHRQSFGFCQCGARWDEGQYLWLEFAPQICGTL